MKSVLIALAALTLAVAPVLLVRFWLTVLMTYDTDKEAANTAMTGAMVAVLLWWVALVYLVRSIREGNARARAKTAAEKNSKLVPVVGWDPETRICPSCGQQVAVDFETRCNHCWAFFLTLA